jgi:hypothetical protein
MIALIASALLGLYVFLPVFIFDKVAEPFVRLKRHERSKTEELVVGVFVAGIPFAITWFLSHHFWLVGHWPFSMEESAAALKIGDYQTVFNGLYSEHFFEGHIDQFWDSFWRAADHQLRFLCWNYLLLFIEIFGVLIMTWQFGRLHQQRWFQATVGKVLLKRVSEWEPLFTSFVFHPKEKRHVEVDLMTTDNHLYRGTIENHFLGKDGELRGLLLKNAKRFQYSKLEADRLAGKQQPLEQYWKDIPGSNMYVPYDKTVTLNLRYELSNPDLMKKLKDKVASLTGISAIVVKIDPPELKPNDSHALDGTEENAPQ